MAYTVKAIGRVKLKKISSPWRIAVPSRPKNQARPGAVENTSGLSFQTRPAKEI